MNSRRLIYSPGIQLILIDQTTRNAIQPVQFFRTIGTLGFPEWVTRGGVTPRPLFPVHPNQRTSPDWAGSCRARSSKTGGHALMKSHLHQRRSGFSSAAHLGWRDSAQSLNKMRTRGRRVKAIAEILGLVGHQSFAEFHDAHGVRWYAVIGKDEFSDPEIAAADNSPDRKTLLVWLDESALLNVAPTADPLARLRIIKHSILAVDFMFDLEIARVRSIPMALQRHPHGSIIHLDLPPTLTAIIFEPLNALCR